MEDNRADCYGACGRPVVGKAEFSAYTGHPIEAGFHRVQVPLDVRMRGLTQKLDMVNQAIDLFRQGETLLEQASRISVEVSLGDGDEGSES